MIQLFKVFMSKDVDQKVLEVLHSGYVGEGERVKELEKQLGIYVGNHRVLAVNSGTSALTMALRLAGVGQGDLVISTPMTCLATNEAILSLGAEPIWADVCPEDGNISVESVERLLTDPATPVERIKALMCVHWGGYPCDVEGLNRIAEQFEIPVVEDAAQALGAVYENKMIGNHSEFVCFSFQAIKYMTTVDGGAITFKNSGQRERARVMRWFGLDREKSSSMRCSQDPPEWGWKMHMNDVLAAIGIENLKHLDELLDKAEDNAIYYRQQLEGVVEMTKYAVGRMSTNWLFTVFVDEPQRFVEFMAERGVECSQAHGRNDTKRIFARSRRSLPGVDRFFSHQVCIPVGWWVGEEEREKIVKSIKEY